ETRDGEYAAFAGLNDDSPSTRCFDLAGLSEERQVDHGVCTGGVTERQQAGPADIRRAGNEPAVRTHFTTRGSRDTREVVEVSVLRLRRSDQGNVLPVSARRADDGRQPGRVTTDVVRRGELHLLRFARRRECRGG